MPCRALLLLFALAVAAPTAAAAPFKSATLGTPVTWHSELAAAQLVASAEQKLVLALHLSGDFRDAARTCAAAQRVRETLNNPELLLLLNRFVGAHQTTGTVTVLKRGSRIYRRQGGDVALFVLTPSGRVVHAIAGSLSPEGLARELSWALTQASDLDQLARAHRSAARELSPLRVLSPAAPHPLGKRLIDLGSGAAPLSPRLKRALIHARLADAASSDLATTSAYVWTRLLGQAYSTVPVRELQIRWRCRIPIQRVPRCVIVRPGNVRELLQEAKKFQIKLRIRKARLRVSVR